MIYLICQPTCWTSGLVRKNLLLGYTYAHMILDPTDLEAWTPEDVSSWKNINIFTAKLTSPDFAPWLTFPIWQLRSALEEPLEPGPILDSRLWVATEWILRSGQVVFEDMTSQDPLGEDTARALATGPLVEPGVSPRSSQRLSFWKNKLLEMHQDSQSLGLDDGTARRMKEAAEGIEQFEGKHRS